VFQSRFVERGFRVFEDSKLVSVIALCPFCGSQYWNLRRHSVISRIVAPSMIQLSCQYNSITRATVFTLYTFSRDQTAALQNLTWRYQSKMQCATSYSHYTTSRLVKFSFGQRCVISDAYPMFLSRKFPSYCHMGNIKKT